MAGRTKQAPNKKITRKKETQKEPLSTVCSSDEVLENRSYSSFSDKDFQLARQCLFGALDNDDDATPLHAPGPFLCLITSNSNKRKIIKPGLSIREQRTLLFETIRHHLPKAAAERFFSGLKGIIDNIIKTEAFITKVDTDNDYGRDDSMMYEEIDDDESSCSAYSFLGFAAKSTCAHLEGRAQHKSSLENSQLRVVQEAYGVALALHTMLYDLSAKDGPVACDTIAAIVTLCESWWAHRAEQKETLVSNVLPILVQWVIQDGETRPTSQVSMKRLYKFRQAFDLVDFSSEESDDLRSLVMQVASLTSCLRSLDGKRFLVFLFQMNDDTIRMNLHQAIRVQIPQCKNSVLRAYAEVYFRSWKEAMDVAIRQALERHVLSDIVYAAVHVANTSMSKSMLTLLEPFHDAKKTPIVEDLLHRMYGPILWRSLTAYSVKVRINAGRILAEVFPLQESSHSHTDQAVKKGCEALEELLLDEDPQVRLAGAESTATILSGYWDVIPTQDIRSLLNHLVAEHASDASSSAVRAGALVAITRILEAPQSRAVLRPLLPPLGNLMHDKVEKVRVAAVRMLRRVAQIPGIKYYHIVPFDHLVSQMANDGRNKQRKSPVASALTSLTMNSFFPSNLSANEQMSRTLAFMTRYNSASVVFYSNLSSHLPVNIVSKLIVMMFCCLHSAVKTAKEQEKEQKRRPRQPTRESQPRKRRRVKGEEETIANDDENGRNGGQQQDKNERQGINASDTALMASLGETIWILLQSIQENLDNEEEYFTRELSDGKFTRVLMYFQQKWRNYNNGQNNDNNAALDECRRTCSAILRVAGWLPFKRTDAVVSYVIDGLASVSTINDPDEVGQNLCGSIAVLCLWGMADEVAMSLADSIEAPLDAENDLQVGSPVSSSRKRKSGNGRRKGIQIPRLRPAVALHILGEVLYGYDCSTISARERLLSSDVARTAIEGALRRGMKHADRIFAADLIFLRSIPPSDVEYVLRVCEVFGRFALHMGASSSSNRDDDDEIAFSQQAEDLLNWTSQSVVPRVVASTGLEPFNDPNLSRISIEKSYYDVAPPSPIIAGPPRRRTNRNTTPNRPSDSGGLGGSSLDLLRTNENSSMINIGRALAVSVLESSCLAFSEWVLIAGKCCVGGDLDDNGFEKISTAAVSWCCKVFDEGVIDEMQDAYVGLVHAFSRLAIQLCKTCGSYLLLKKMLLTCRDVMVDENNFKVISETMSIAISSSLLVVRGFQKMVVAKNTVGCLLNAIYDVILDGHDGSVHHCGEFPMSIEDLWQEEDLEERQSMTNYTNANAKTNATVIKSVFSMIFENSNHRHARIELAKILIASIKNDGSSSSGTPVATRNRRRCRLLLFAIRCLWLLCDSNKKDATTIVDLIRRSRMPSIVVLERDDKNDDDHEKNEIVEKDKVEELLQRLLNDRITPNT